VLFPLDGPPKRFTIIGFLIPFIVVWLLVCLIDEGYTEDDILYRKIDMPKIMYVFEDKEKRYYPDFYIKSENLIVEVKCTYTYEVEKDKNDIKFSSTKDLGYKHRLMIL
jgi:hypothetical protein